MRSAGPSPHAPPSLGLVDGLHHGLPIQQNDLGLEVLPVACTVEVAEVDVGRTLVRLGLDPHADVAVPLVLPVERVTDSVLTGLILFTESAHRLGCQAWPTLANNLCVI